MNFNIDRYEILGELGRGAMATVFKAFDPRIKRELAIKILRPEHCVNPDFRNRFLRETQAVGKLNHPNIVKIYDVGETNGQPYIAMELLSGRFLDKAAENKRFSVNETIRIGTQLAAALERAHSFGVIHRDIKPANIAWSEKTQQAILTDFGIARIENLEITRSTLQGQVLGTPKYMSPEQILGKSLDARTDLFSLGVVLYQLLTGHKPFGGDTLAALTYQIAHQNPEPLEHTVRNIPAHLNSIINKLLSKEPEQRFQSATELLQAFQQSETTSAGKNQQHNWLPMGLAVTAVAMIVLGLIKHFPSNNIEPPTQIETTSIPAIPKQGITPNAAKIDRNKIVSGSNLDEQIQEKIAYNLLQFECASLSSQADANNALLVKGHISHEEDLLALMDMMDTVPGISNVTYDIKSLSWPFCEVASILSTDRQSNVVSNRGLHVETRANSSSFSEGNPVDLELFTPDFESYVYVDYFRSDGSVVHLYPTDNRPAKHAPLKSISITSNAKQWKVQKPFGENQIVVMATNEPLIGERPTKENAQDYLSLLHKQIVTQQKHLTAKYLMVTTVPKH
ncbi:MAG: serine/threonine-protein kinase [Gammaproteobacteria bacterium]|nr:serine/threonine-protein kinase [Gammaproteobacteria bacterium]MDH5802422.1 serine/threonine-protein kinase [Gammaproteobacteria bacterium]